MANTSDAGKKPGQMDMKKVISQLEKNKKPTTALRPTETAASGAKPKPPISGSKPQTESDSIVKSFQKSITEKQQQESGTNQKPTTSTSFKPQAGNAQTPENPFKVALRPVSKTGAGGSSTPDVSKEKPALTEKNDTTVNVSKLISNKMKSFENNNQQSEGPASNSTTATGSNTKPTTPQTGTNTKPTVPAASNSLKPITTSPQQAKGVSTPDTSAKPNFKVSTLPKGNKFETKAEESKDDKKVSLSNHDAKKAEEDDSGASGKKGSGVQASKFGAKPPTETNFNTLPKPFKVPSTSQEPVTCKTIPDEEIKRVKEPEQPKIPPRKDQQKIEEKEAEDKQNTKDILKPTNNRKVEPPKNKLNNVKDNNAQNSQSNLQNKERPLPKVMKDGIGKKENQKSGPKYKLLPVPKKVGNPPRKLAKPPVVDLNKYAKYGTIKGTSTSTSSTRPVPGIQSAQSYDEDGELYEDCENVSTVPSRQQSKSNRISELTEEEEAVIERSAKSNNNNKTDNYGKMCKPPEYEDDDEIYQEID